MLRVAGWTEPRGYTNGICAAGTMVVLAGQIGWNPSTGLFETDDFAAQVRQTLANIVQLLEEAGAAPEDLVRLTWFVTDRDEYVRAHREIGAAYRATIGSHYPPMSVVIVAGLLEPRAKVEIEATAVVPRAADPA